MRILTPIIFILFSYSCISQKAAKDDVIRQISSADTVLFVVTTSGCFNSGTVTYKIAKKKKSKDRIVIFTNNNVKESKVLSAKNYDAFLNNYRISHKKYSELENGSCTLLTDFELKGKNQSSAFTNKTCEAEFNPEEILKKLMK